MKRLAIAAAASIALIAACGDSTGPREVECLQEKVTFLEERYGPDFSPTPELLQQSQFNLGGVSWVRFTSAPGGCTLTFGSG